MPTAALSYKLAGIQRLLSFKPVFETRTASWDNLKQKEINRFVDLFCEYQLADNNYMNIQLEAATKGQDEKWFAGLNLEDVLKYLTYIIWTDKFIDGYISTKIEDGTFRKLLDRLEGIQNGLVLSSSKKEGH